MNVTMFETNTTARFADVPVSLHEDALHMTRCEQQGIEPPRRRIVYESGAVPLDDTRTLDMSLWSSHQRASIVRIVAAI